MQAKDRMDVPKSLRKDWEDLVSPSSSLASPGTGDVRASTKAGQKPTPTNRTEAVKNAMTADVDSIEILRQIRESADAVVYEAWDHSAKRDVAIHMLRTEAQSDTSLVDDFWRRSQSQAKTDHSNIVSIYSIEQPAGRVVAEFCKPAFDEELPKNGWSEAEVRRLLQDTLSGLEYLHRQGKIHGALAPAVIMSSEMGTFKLDRISGRRVGEELQLLPGNEKYLAPEILDESRFGAVGEAVDLYALGMIALEALSGRKFLSCFADCGLDLEAGGETWLRWHAASEERVAEVATVLPKVDPRLAATIDRLLSKQVGDRPRSASDALAILNSHTPTIVASTERTNSSVTSLSASDLALRPSAVTARRTEGSALSTVATMGMESRNAPASWQQRLDGLFAEENANKVAAGILLLVTFIAGLAFFEPQKSQEDEG
ncbi:MAG: protein kinase, partial [Planctomycetota bacterium]